MKCFFSTKLILILICGVSIIPKLEAQNYFHAANGSTVTISSGTTVYVGGDASLVTGSNTTNDGLLMLTGSLTSTGIAKMQSGTVHFKGSSAEYFSGLLPVGNLIIENTLGGLTLNGSITVNTATTFTSGLVFSDAANLLIYTNGASPGSPTDGSHVSGPVKYLGTGSFTYPVGNNTYYRPVGTNLSADGSGVTAYYTQLNGTAYPPGNPVFSDPLVTVSKHEYWDISPVSTATGTVSLNWDASKVPSGIVNSAGVNAIKVAHYSGGQWISEGGTGSGTTTNGSITSDNIISTWSPFTLGSTNSTLAPLPLNFLSISATLEPGGSRLVKWNVAQEINVKGYTVEYSTDGQYFSIAGAVSAAGSGNGQAYNFTDVTSMNGRVIYYRVYGTDVDGRKHYSNIVALHIGTSGVIKVSPNPVSGYMNISFGDHMKGAYNMQIVSSNGALVYSKGITATDNETLTVNRPAYIAQGLYLVKLVNESGEVFSYKILFK